MIYSAYGGFCSTCEQLILDYNYCVDARTGKLAPEEFNQEVWPHLLLLCRGCWESHKSNLADYSRADILLPYDTYRFSPEPPSEFVYENRPVQVEIVNGSQVVEEYTEKAVLVSGTTERAKNSVRHFRLNSLFFLEPDKLRISYDDPRINRDSRLRARVRAWELGKYVAAKYKEKERARVSAEWLQRDRELLSHGGCWSTSLTSIWQEIPSPELIRTLFDNKHPGVRTITDKKRATITEFVGPVPGNEWPGTRMTLFDREAG